MKNLQIVLCLLACLCVASVVPIAVFFQYYCLIPIAGAFGFYIAMFAVKRASTHKPEKPSFMKSDEENARIHASQEHDKDE